jgi:hypothetical protein
MRRETRVKRALKMKPVATNPPEAESALFPDTKPIPKGREA